MNAVRLVLILVVTLTPVALAADYFPLQTGNQWSYMMSNGTQMTVTVTGVAPVRGVRCAVVETTMGAQTSREYMALMPDGLKTYKMQAQGREFIYDPPVARIKLPFQAGQTWSSTANQFGMSVTTRSQSMGTQRIQTPVGTFECLKIQSTVTLPGQAPMVSQSYYAPGIGLVYQTILAGGQEQVARLMATNVGRAPQPQPAQPTPQPQQPRLAQPSEQPVPPQQSSQPQPQEARPTWPSRPTPLPGRTGSPKKTRCTACNALVDSSAKFCPQCGAKIVRPVAPTTCPQCKSKLPPGAKFCPACGTKLAVPAAAEPAAPQVAPETETAPAPTPGPRFEKYVSPDGTVMLYKLPEWTVHEQELDNGAYLVAVTEPQDNAAVVFTTFPAEVRISDSVELLGEFIKSLRDQFPDLAATSVKSTPDKDRTIAEISFTDAGKKGIGHVYCFHTPRAGTVYMLMAYEPVWPQFRPMLTNVAANLAYTPDGVAAVTAQGREIATEAQPAESGQAVSPALLLQRASEQPGMQLPLREITLPDESASLQIPQGWNIEGRQLQFIAVNDAQTRTHGMGSTKHTVVSTDTSIPGVLNGAYRPPAQALKFVLESGRTTRDVEVLSQCSVEEAMPELAQAIRYSRVNGLQVDARMIYARFRNVPTGMMQRGLFSVQCLTSPMSTTWQVSIQGYWTPEGEFDRWLPLFLRLEKTIQVNQQWFSREMQGRAAMQQRLNQNLMSSIAGAGQAFDDYLTSVQNADRSRDYTSWMWSQTTLGQGTWVAESEGANVYRTDSWGLEGPEGRIDHPTFNTTNFTGENPWSGSRLEMVDTRDEYDQYIAN